MGIRIALGAPRGEVLALVAGEELAMALIGVAIRVARSLSLTRVLASLLFGIGPRDVSTFGSARRALVVALTRVPASLLFGISPRHASAFASARGALVVALTRVLASLLFGIGSRHASPLGSAGARSWSR